MNGVKRAQAPEPRRPLRQALATARGPGDDIPEARRLVALQPVRQRRRRTALLAAGLALAALVLALLSGPLLGWLTPPPVPGLAARLTPDGRLLGHFPYAEAPAHALVAIGPGQQLHRDAAAALAAMRQAAAADGVDLVVLSAFRPIALQKHLFFDVKSERAQSSRQRAQVSAPPGYSEHSTGYALDLGDGGAPATNLAEAFDTTASFRWLQGNAARFHFALSFPRGNAQGVSYEPWHWRFEGSAEALRLFEAAHRLEQ